MLTTDTVFVHDRTVSGRIKSRLANEATRCGGKREVLGGTSQAHIEMVVVRVDRGRAPRKVREDPEFVRVGTEAPRLRVMAARRESRESNDFSQVAARTERTALNRHRTLVFGEGSDTVETRRDPSDGRRRGTPKNECSSLHW